jgi:phage baseplate assembly protein W
MLTLDVTFSDTDIVANQSGVGTIQVTIVITEDDPFLAQKLVSGSIAWGDGSLPISFDVTPSPIVRTLSNTFVPGIYVVVVQSRNYRVPTEDKQSRITTLVVRSSTITVPDKGTIFGPILPRDNGFPNTQQWNLNIDKDLKVLESSVKMLLITEVGERVMEPTYGTNLRSVLFTPDQRLAQNLVTNEIASAVAKWEPRVQLASVDMTRDSGGRSATVVVTFVSKLTNQPFQLNLNYNR